MNKFLGVGSLPRNAVVKGSNNKVLRFTLATRHGFNKKTGKDLWSFVPCVVFRPTEAMQAIFTENGKGLVVELEGRVNTSKFQTKDGQTKYSTEVVVDAQSIRALDAHYPPESDNGESHGDE